MILEQLERQAFSLDIQYNILLFITNDIHMVDISSQVFTKRKEIRLLIYHGVRGKEKSSKRSKIQL